MMNYSEQELIEVVAWMAERYTSRESTSITYEKANQLMEAVVFCISAAQKGELGQFTVVNPTSKEAAKEAYERGYEILYNKVTLASYQYNKLIPTFESYGNRAYYDTVVKGLPEFFLHYDLVYEPQNCLLTLDYPTLDPVYDLKGIHAISAFIRQVQWEQQFLKRLPKEAVIGMLRSYHEEYEDLMINICQIVVSELLLRMIDRSAAFETKESLSTALHTALHLLIKREYSNDAALEAYLRLCIPEILVDYMDRKRWNK